MCKHVAATLYGVGARLDERPELLFRLRAVDENDLVAGLDEALPFSNQPLDVGRILETEDISALFGLDIEEAGGATAPNDAAPATTESADRPGRKRLTKKAAGRKKVVAPHPTTADSEAAPETAKGVAQRPVVPNTTPAKRTRKPGSAGKTTDGINPAKPTKRTRPTGDSKLRAGSKGTKGTRKRKKPKPQFELTPDGFVKWWK